MSWTPMGGFLSEFHGLGKQKLPKLQHQCSCSPVHPGAAAGEEAAGTPDKVGMGAGMGRAEPTICALIKLQTAHLQASVNALSLP